MLVYGFVAFARLVVILIAGLIGVFVYVRAYLLVVFVFSVCWALLWFGGVVLLLSCLSVFVGGVVFAIGCFLGFGLV